MRTPPPSIRCIDVDEDAIPWFFIQSCFSKDRKQLKANRANKDTAHTTLRNPQNPFQASTLLARQEDIIQIAQIILQTERQSVADAETLARVMSIVKAPLPNKRRIDDNAEISVLDFWKYLLQWVFYRCVNGFLPSIEAYDLLKIIPPSVGGRAVLERICCERNPVTRVLLSKLLFSTINNKSKSLARFMLQNGADPKDCHGFASTRWTHDREMTALHRAAQLHDTEAVKLLLEYGANPNDAIVSSIDETALLLALERPGGTDIIALLIENKTNLHASLHQDLHSASSQPFNQYLIEAVTNKDSKSVELLVDKGADINVLPALCQPSALQTAIEADDIEKVDMLLALGADPIGRLRSNFSTTDSELTLPLTAAARYHDTIATQKLIRAGANIDDFIPPCSNAVYSYRWSKTNQTALQASIESCNYDITRLLLRHGIDPDIRDCTTSMAL